MLVAIALAYTALVLPAAVITKLTPVCLPGLIDFNADIEGLLFAVLPALLVGWQLRDSPRKQHGLVVFWLLTQTFRIIDGPGMIPDFLSLAMLLVFTWILRHEWRAALPLGLLAIAAAINHLGAHVHDQPLRQDGLMLAAAAFILLVLLFLPRSLRWLNTIRAQRSKLMLVLQPWAVLIVGGATFRLLFSYDYWGLIAAAGLWIAGFVLALFHSPVFRSLLKNENTY